MSLSAPEEEISTEQMYVGFKDHLQNILIQTDKVRLGKDQIQVFECLSKPEAFHLVAHFGQRVAHVLDGGVSILCARYFVDAFEHTPSCILERLVAGDAIHDENRLDSLRSE